MVKSVVIHKTLGEGVLVVKESYDDYFFTTKNRHEELNVFARTSIAAAIELVFLKGGNTGIIYQTDSGFIIRMMQCAKYLGINQDVMVLTDHDDLQAYIRYYFVEDSNEGKAA